MEWIDVKKAFFEALELEPSARAAFMAQLANGDPDLGRKVDSLLAWNASASRLLADPALAGLSGFPAPDGPAGDLTTGDAAALRPGEKVGPYRIVREIGRGGMGVVYEAEQLEPVRRRVALKLIRWGLWSSEVMARFETERQALAVMNHPSIATVYGAGTAASGRPYFVMELVDGQPITRYCDDRRLGIGQRLELFLRLCDGVQHAHHKGVIHRDLKPTNVLVKELDEVPLPKIIDFGIAKATEQRLTEGTAYTQLGQLIGTPEYMSPEQAETSNPDIDTRTDVYSLGALLYELLVGAPPFDPARLRAAGFDELRRQIREDDPPRPSARAATSLAATLRGDLDWIVMKALAKDREQRYAGAAELAKDIRRYLRHEPVLASPPGTIYRLRKFARRHRLAVLAAVLFTLATLTAVAGVTGGLVRARRAERQATQEAAKAKAINQFLQETLGAANPEGELGRETTVAEALDRAIEQVDERFANQPEIEAAVRNTIGVTYRALGRQQEAEQQIRAALRMREDLFEEHADLAESYNELGLLLAELGDHDAAEGHYRRAIELHRKVGGEESEKLASSLMNLGVVLHSRKQYAEAEPLLRRSTAMYRKLHGDEHEMVAVGYANLASVTQRQERFEEAGRLHRDSLAIYRKVLREDHPRVAIALNNLAWFHAMRGDHAEADEVYVEAVAACRRALGDEHWMVAIMRRNHARSLIELGRYEEAERKLFVSYRSGLANDQPQVLSPTLETLVSLYQAWGRPEEAERRRTELAAVRSGEQSPP